MTVSIAPTSGAEARLWALTAEVSSLFAGIEWALIGAQMVVILERERGVTLSRLTRDVDALIDVRADTHATRAAAERLCAAGFEPQPTSDGFVYRFVRGDDRVDLLAPDHVGSRADLTTAPPGGTIAIAGGRQALTRARPVELDVEGRSFWVPVPSLTGALVIKARAAASSHDEKHRWDLARLLALVGDVNSIRADLTRRERGYLRDRVELLDPDHPAWAGIANADDAIIALRRLAD